MEDYISPETEHVLKTQHFSRFGYPELIEIQITSDKTLLVMITTHMIPTAYSKGGTFSYPLIWPTVKARILP